MASIKYKTRGMGNPQGKQKVFFSCHPWDRNRFFEQITDDILRFHNCAIWYDEEPEAPYDKAEYERIIKSMNLIVIPITSNFLNKNNRARDLDFVCAQKHHIPVLPLMLEQGLEDAFNRICGELQFLDPFCKDITVNSYEEKFKGYLNSILLKDELVKRIRAAFEAYIFLSYRKKDRVYAQELMRLIHKNDFCRDIAIWYDEYLTPGENFNESIEAALRKSDLFAMVVTPNLVNEENYVMSVEYPMAKACGKSILPVEMTNTDKELLYSQYSECPDCVSGQGKQLTDRLWDLVKKLGLEEQNSSPEHKLYIGLAYLSGVDVEKDVKKAVELIREAANAGVIEAGEKLVSMYKNGEGVERDYDSAIEWQDKIVNELRIAYNKKPDIENGILLVEQLFGYSKLYDDMKQYSRAIEILEQIEVICAKQVEKSKNTIWSSAYAHFYVYMGALQKCAGHFKVAKECYEKSISIRESLPKGKWGADEYFILARTYQMLGLLCLEEWKYEDACRYFEKGIALAQKMDNELKRSEALGAGYNNLGLIMNEMGKKREALEYYEKSMPMREYLAEVTRAEHYKNDLAATYGNMSIVYMLLEQWDKAKTYCAKSIEIREGLVKETSSIFFEEELAISYNNMASIYQKADQYEQAMEFFEKTTDILEQSDKRSGSIKIKKNLASAYANMSVLCREKGKKQHAVRYLEKCVLLREALPQKTDDMWNSLMNAYIYLASLYMELGKKKQASTYLGKGIQIKEKLKK